MLLNYLFLNFPTWLFALLGIGLIALFSSLGLLIFKRLVPITKEKDNSFISYPLATISLFCSILISLIAISSWQSYIAAEQKVDQEARLVEGVYRMSQGLPEPIKHALQANMIEYIQIVLIEEWPAMLKNQAYSTRGTEVLTRSNNILHQFNDTNPVALAYFKNVLEKLNLLLDARRDRVLAEKVNFPIVIWLVVSIAAFLNIFICYFFILESAQLHIIVTSLIAATIGSILVLIIIFNHPFQGDIAIQPDAFLDFNKSLGK